MQQIIKNKVTPNDKGNIATLMVLHGERALNTLMLSSILCVCRGVYL